MSISELVSGRRSRGVVTALAVSFCIVTALVAEIGTGIARAEDSDAPETRAFIHVAYDESPEIVFKTDAVVPDSLFELATGDIVMVQVHIDTAGCPGQLRVLAGDSLLYWSVLDAVSQWRFTPARWRGVKQPIKITCPVRVIPESADTLAPRASAPDGEDDRATEDE